MKFKVDASAAGIALLCAFAAACDDSAAGPPAAASQNEGVSFASGEELRVAVPEAGRVFVRLDDPAIAPAPADAKSLDWDLAFEGFEIFSNGGVSGGGKAAVFGPLDAITFLDDVAPQVPFLFSDKAGGAFVDWYAYESETHALYSRFHVFGVKDGARLWKVQILGYYGQRDGAPVTGLYSVRYAELLPSGSGPTTELAAVDGTAGGVSGSPSAPSGCLDLATGTRSTLGPEAAGAKSDWHLCFRRQTVSVNGGLGGKRGVTAVDLDAAKVAGERVADIKARTSESEKAAFEAVITSSFDGKDFRGDRIVSGFGDGWLDRTKSPLEPKSAAWLVAAASGTKKFLVGFEKLEGPTTKTPGTVVMRIKPV